MINNNNILDDIQINKHWIAPGGSNAIIIDGIYKGQTIIAKLGFIGGEEGHIIYNEMEMPAFVFGLENEKDINEKIINKMDSLYVVKMLDYSYLDRNITDLYFKNDLIKLENKSLKLCKNNQSWCGFNFSKLIIMIFKKVDTFIPLRKFKGNLKDWLNILWNVCQVLNQFNLYGLRHNDFHWLNILVIKNIDCTTIKIIDYGESSVQPTKLNNKLKIINKSRGKEGNKKDLKNDINKFVKSMKYNKHIPINIQKLIQQFNNKTPLQSLQIIKNFK
jgi:ribonuclease HI